MLKPYLENIEVNTMSGQNIVEQQQLVDEVNAILYSPDLQKAKAALMAAGLTDLADRISKAESLAA